MPKFTIDRSPPEVTDLELDLVAQANPTGKLIVSGVALIKDGTSNTVLVAENRGSSATCSQGDDNALAFESLTISLRHARASERLLATITPLDRGITESGRYDAMLRIHDDVSGSYEVSLTVDFEGHPGLGPHLSGRR